MISEDVCYIGRGEKQYPLGNSSKKKVCFAPFFSFFLRFHFVFLSHLQYTKARQAMIAAMPCVLWSAECRLRV